MAHAGLHAALTSGRGPIDLMALMGFSVATGSAVGRDDDTSSVATAQAASRALNLNADSAIPAALSASVASCDALRGNNYSGELSPPPPEHTHSPRLSRSSSLNASSSDRPLGVGALALSSVAFAGEANCKSVSTSALAQVQSAVDLPSLVHASPIDAATSHNADDQRDVIDLRFSLPSSSSSSSSVSERTKDTEPLSVLDSLMDISAAKRHAAAVAAGIEAQRTDKSEIILFAVTDLDDTDRLSASPSPSASALLPSLVCVQVLQRLPCDRLRSAELASFDQRSGTLVAGSTASPWLESFDLLTSGCISKTTISKSTEINLAAASELDASTRPRGLFIHRNNQQLPHLSLVRVLLGAPSSRSSTSASSASKSASSAPFFSATLSGSLHMYMLTLRAEKALPSPRQSVSNSENSALPRSSSPSSLASLPLSSAALSSSSPTSKLDLILSALGSLEARMRSAETATLRMGEQLNERLDRVERLCVAALSTAQKRNHD
jgi:hypothetical protein